VEEPRARRPKRGRARRAELLDRGERADAALGERAAEAFGGRERVRSADPVGVERAKVGLCLAERETERIADERPLVERVASTRRTRPGAR
jgi:hypothetical protein